MQDQEKEIEIVRIKPSNFAFLVSAFYFFFGLLAAIFTLISSVGAIPPRSATSMIGSFTGTIVLFPIIGWICGLLFAAIYNLIARISSGVKIYVTTNTPTMLASNLDAKTKE